jgi:Na+-translocating ferredoxin:NAD+ oxidoreductase RnfD subunit
VNAINLLECIIFFGGGGGGGWGSKKGKKNPFNQNMIQYIVLYVSFSKQIMQMK